MQQLVQAPCQRFELRGAVLNHAITSLKSQRETEELQFDKVSMFARLCRQTGEQVEELFAAPRFVMKRDEQTVRGPCAAATTGRECGGFVERGAQAIACADDRFDRHGRVLRARLKTPDFRDE